MNSPLFPTTLSIPSYDIREVGRANDLPALLLSFWSWSVIIAIAIIKRTAAAVNLCLFFFTDIFQTYQHGIGKCVILIYVHDNQLIAR